MVNTWTIIGFRFTIKVTFSEDCNAFSCFSHWLQLNTQLVINRNNIPHSNLLSFELSYYTLLCNFVGSKMTSFVTLIMLVTSNIWEDNRT